MARVIATRLPRMCMTSSLPSPSTSAHKQMALNQPHSLLLIYFILLCEISCFPLPPLYPSQPASCKLCPLYPPNLPLQVLSRKLYLPAVRSGSLCPPTIVAVDLQPMAPIEGVIQLQGDITSQATAQQVRLRTTGSLPIPARAVEIPPQFQICGRGLGLN